MKKEPAGYLYEEFDIKTGDLKSLILWSFHPKELSYLNDLKGSTHHIKITPLFRGDKFEEYKAMNKYDSKRLSGG
jgi:hypothetical protein